MLLIAVVRLNIVLLILDSDVQLWKFILKSFLILLPKI